MPRLSTARSVLLLVAAALLLVVGAYLALSLTRPSAAPADKPEAVPAAVAPAELHAAWVRDVRSALQGLSDQAAPDLVKAARERIFGLRVASADKDAHLALVMALLAWERGEAGAYARVQAALGQVHE